MVMLQRLRTKLRKIMAQLNVTGYFHFTAAPEDAVSFKIMVPYAAINRGAYGDIKQDPFDIVVRKTEGNNFKDIRTEAEMREELMSLERYVHTLDKWVVQLISDEISESEMIDGLKLRLFLNISGVATMINEVNIPVIQENPTPFPRPETEWDASLLLKNGEYMLLDNVIYMWKHYQSGNSTINPQDDIAQNPLTTKWVAYQNWPILFTNALIAKFGLLGSAVFDGHYMMSQYGSDENGNQTNDYRNFGNGNFNPNILFNFLTGKSKLKDTEIDGIIHLNGMSGKMQIQYVELNKSDSVYARHEFFEEHNNEATVVTGYKLRENTHIVITHDDTYSQAQKHVLLPNSPDYIGVQVKIIDTNTPPYTRTSLSYCTVVYGGMYGLLRSGGYVGTTTTIAKTYVELRGGSLNLIGIPKYGLDGDIIGTQWALDSYVLD